MLLDQCFATPRGTDGAVHIRSTRGLTMLTIFFYGWPVASPVRGMGPWHAETQLLVASRNGLGTSALEHWLAPGTLSIPCRAHHKLGKARDPKSTINQTAGEKQILVQMYMISQAKPNRPLHSIDSVRKRFLEAEPNHEHPPFFFS